MIPIALTRTYRQPDNDCAAVRVGMTHPYAMFLWSAQQYQQAHLILLDGGRVHYVRVSSYTSWTDAIFAHQETRTTAAAPTAFYQSTIRWNGHGWTRPRSMGLSPVRGECAAAGDPRSARTS